MKRKFLLILIFVLAGCSSPENEYKTYEEALQFLFKEERLREEDILKEYHFRDNYFVIFESRAGNVVGYGVANFIKKSNGTFTWYDTSSKINLDNKEEGPIGTEFYSNKGKKVTFQIGRYDEGSSNENMHNFGITEVDFSRNIYYMLDIEQ